MFKPEIVPAHVFFLLFLFWSVWLYTEVTEYFERDEFNHEVSDFMNKGDRNTKEMGLSLCQHIRALEENSESPIDCEKIYSLESQ